MVSPVSLPHLNALPSKTLLPQILPPKILPRVVIDARMVGEIPHGIARYVTQIAKGLRQAHQNKNLSYEPIFLVNSSLFDKNRDFLNSFFEPFQTLPVDAAFLNLKEIFVLPKIIQSAHADLYHSPSFSSLWNCPCPSMVTIHDLNHLTYGSWMTRIYYQVLLRRFAQHSKQITTVSQFSQAEIVHWLKRPKQEIEVIYNAIEPISRIQKNDLKAQTTLKEFGIEAGQYFFCLSNSKPHKNLELLIDAYQQYRTQAHHPWPLVITIKNGETQKSTPLPGVHLIGAVEQEKIGILLTQAAGMFFPSLYEGFGLPPLEAASVGTRLVISRIPPHEEGLADLKTNEVLWVDPTDQAHWSRAFQKIQEQMIDCPSAESQKRILNRFSAERLGQHIDQIYQRMLKN